MQLISIYVFLSLLLSPLYSQNIEVSYVSSLAEKYDLRNHGPVPERLTQEQVDITNDFINTTKTLYSLKVDNLSKSKFVFKKRIYAPQHQSTYSTGISRTGDYIKDIKNKTLYIIEGLLGENEMVKIDLSTLNQWKLIDADTIINDFACKKAINTVDNAIAWYTLDIPVTEGPYHYCLLPGLIVFLNNGIDKYELTDIVSIPDDEVEIEIPKKKKIVSWEKFKKIAPQFTKPGSKKKK